VNELIVRNARVVTPGEVLEPGCLAVREGRIAAVGREGPAGGREEIDAGGAWLLPGLVDLHNDALEREIEPRPRAVFPLPLALAAFETRLVSLGITTIFHSLAFMEGRTGMARAEKLEAMILELARLERTGSIRHLLHARYEIVEPGFAGLLARLLEAGQVHLVSFMDHTPGQGQFRNLEIYRKTIKGYRNMSETELDRMIEDIQTRKRLTADDVAEIAGIAAEHGAAVASHDDDTLGKLALVKSFGTRISEFPITLEIAREARRLGLHTVAGAPNILLGGSHSGNLSAAEAILDGSVDVLCSDYYPAALLHAVFRMHREHGLPLHEMVNLATRNAAAAVGMEADLGSLEAGKKADLLVVDELEDGFPVVTAAFVDGLPILRTSYRR
jgi:alpha-D-ribose 1-methylphosphonate 5-triphosphate diphosphatase